MAYEQISVQETYLLKNWHKFPQAKNNETDDDRIKAMDWSVYLLLALLIFTAIKFI